MYVVSIQSPQQLL
jgi:hypothetical protein